MRKQDKVDMVNEAISQSSTAKKKDAKAEILPDGRIEYSMIAYTRSGRPYRIKVSLYEILSLLDGKDIRNIKGVILKGSDIIKAHHLAEAIQYRPKPLANSKVNPIKPGTLAIYKSEVVRVIEQIGNRIAIWIPSRQEEVWIKPDKITVKKNPILPEIGTKMMVEARGLTSLSRKRLSTIYDAIIAKSTKAMSQPLREPTKAERARWARMPDPFAGITQKVRDRAWKRGMVA